MDLSATLARESPIALKCCYFDFNFFKNIDFYEIQNGYLLDFLWILMTVSPCFSHFVPHFSRPIFIVFSPIELTDVWFNEILTDRNNIGLFFHAFFIVEISDD